MLIILFMKNEKLKFIVMLCGSLLMLVYIFGGIIVRAEELQAHVTIANDLSMISNQLDILEQHLQKKNRVKLN